MKTNTSSVDLGTINNGMYIIRLYRKDNKEWVTRRCCTSNFFILGELNETKMKLQNTLFALVLMLSVNAQEWISDSECKSESAKIINQAISHLVNIEQSVAVGMAKAVMISDKKCECAKLVLAAAASGNQDFGSRKAKLSEVNASKLVRRKGMV